MPTGGYQVGDLSLKFPTKESFFAIKKDSLLDKGLILKDSTFMGNEYDSLKIQQKLDSLKKVNSQLQALPKAKASLNNFWKKLENARNSKVRILHYGDSQIEGDRITGFLRNELQKKFGGSGAGLFSVIPVSRKISVDTEYSENWKRYTGFGKKDTLVTHNSYGALMNFSRYAPIYNSLRDSIKDSKDSINYTAWIKVKKPRRSYAKTKVYHQFLMYYSNFYHTLNYKIIVDGVYFKEGILPANTPFDVLELNFETTPNEIEIFFEGKDSPDIYGLSLESRQGVIMDNIPLRGASGTLFTRQNEFLLQSMYTHLKPNLLLLEFGGNVIPYIKTQKGAERYGRLFTAQIKLLKRLNPEIPIIVIGPGDMSIKEETEYITHPSLILVRDILKKVSLANGCVFWDMYEVMGGENSMVEWVNAEPSLATTDYIHFNVRGAKKIAQEFYKKLMDQYDAFKNPEVLNLKKDSLELQTTIKNDTIELP